MQNNTFFNNGGYGVFANTSSTTLILDNTASGSGEAGIYVGDSPNAKALVRGNTVFDNGFGIFIRSASNGASGNTVTANSAHGNVPADLGDLSGASNFFSANSCDTSVPGGLCGHTVTTSPATTTPPAG